MWPALIPVLGSILDKIFPDASKSQEAKAKLMEMQLNGELQTIVGQLDINKVEAGNASVFVSGWRPAIGWVCAIALAYQYLFRPVLSFIAAYTGHAMPTLPGLDDNLWQLMLGMLGLGGLRTFEKVNGVTK